MTVNQQFPRLAASACVWRDHRVLLIQRTKPLAGIWSLPGGHVDPGEATLEAAHRELLEETGVTAALDTLVGLYDVIRHDAEGLLIAHYAVACYTGHWLSGDPVAATDAMDAQWFELSEIARLSTTQGLAEILARAKALLA